MSNNFPFFFLYLLGLISGGGGSVGGGGDYAPSLDFSDARNSQYIGQVV